MSDTTTDQTEPFQLPDDSTWIDAVELFQREASAWLTPADAPQLMALRSIAQQLDKGKFQAALISQFTLIHRTLRDKGDPERAKGGAKPDPNDPAMLDIFKGIWRGDQ
jgi:hypothetical protein